MSKSNGFHTRRIFLLDRIEHLTDALDFSIERTNLAIKLFNDYTTIIGKISVRTNDKKLSLLLTDFLKSTEADKNKLNLNEKKLRSFNNG